MHDAKSIISNCTTNLGNRFGGIINDALVNEMNAYNQLTTDQPNVFLTIVYENHPLSPTMFTATKIPNFAHTYRRYVFVVIFR